MMIPDSVQGIPSPLQRRIRHCAALSLLAAFLCFHVSPVFAEEETFTAFRPYQGLIRRDMAERACLAAADLAGKQQAMRLLAKNPDLHFAVGENETPSLPLLEGLAAKLFATRALVFGRRGFPPELEVFIEVRLERPKNLRKVVHEALLRPDSLELHARILERQAALLAEYDARTPRLLERTPQAGGAEEELHQLQALIRNIDALSLLSDLLKVYEAQKNSFENISAQVEKMHASAPSEPLIRLVAAEVLLRLGRPVEAMAHITASARSLPNYARIHDVQGAVYLYQRLPALAADAFSKAIALAPKNAEYYAHRASAYLIQENSGAMCADFRTACALGNCEGYQWGEKTELCLPEEKADKQDGPTSEQPYSAP